MSTQTVPLATPKASLRNVYLYFTQTAAPNTPATGLAAGFTAAQIQVVINGAAPVNSSGTFTEVSAVTVPGLYIYQCTATEISTPGPVTLYPAVPTAFSPPFTLQVLMPADAVDAGTAQAGAAQTITLEAGASGTDQSYQANRIVLVGGTGQGQSRQVCYYKGSTKVATVDRPWTTNPDNTTVYTLVSSEFPTGTVRVNLAQGGGGSTITFDAGASTTDQTYDGTSVAILAGTGAGQTGLVNTYTGSTRVAQMTAGWETAPDATSVFAILALGGGQLTSGAISSGTFQTGAINANAFASSAIAASAIASNAITAAKIASAALTSAKFDNTVNIQVANTGTMQAGSTGTTAVLASAASSVSNTYDTMRLYIVSGTGAGQSQVITAYAGSTRTATMAGTWATTPDATSVYQVVPNG